MHILNIGKLSDTVNHSYSFLVAFFLTISNICYSHNNKILLLHFPHLSKDSFSVHLNTQVCKIYWFPT